MIGRGVIFLQKNTAVMDFLVTYKYS